MGLHCTASHITLFLDPSPHDIMGDSRPSDDQAERLSPQEMTLLFSEEQQTSEQTGG